MKSSLILGSLFAVAALAKPLHKRDQVTKYVIITKTVVVQGSAPTPTFIDTENRESLVSAVSVVPTTAAAALIVSSSTDDESTTSTSTKTSKTSPAVAQQNGGGDGDSSSSGTSSSYSAAVLAAHNVERSKHGVSGLVWSDKMASIAQQIAQSCVYEHDVKTGGGGYGQNIGAGTDESGVPDMIKVQMYDNEIGKYPGYGREPSMSTFTQWGHFTQIVWKSTVSVGCATVYCPKGLANTGGNVRPYFTVCNYSPPGNYQNQFSTNVLAPH